MDRLTPFWTVCALASASSLAEASTGIVTESVIDYGCGGCCVSCPDAGGACDDQCNDNANAAGFVYTLEGAALGFSSLVVWQDGNVYDSDFLDPDIVGSVGVDADDTDNFDQSGTSITFYSGHGVVAGHRSGCEGSAQACTHNSECNKAIAPEYGSGACVSGPEWGVGNGQCCYATKHQLYVHGSSNPNGNYVSYDNGEVEWGESPSSGNWAGAAENGSTNLVVLNASWPVTQNFGWDNLVTNMYGPVLGGARLIAATLPTDGDTADIPDRGSAFAQFASTNPSGAVLDAWADAINNLETSDGHAGDNCPRGYGFNGCGCHLIVATGANELQSNSSAADDWLDVQYDTYDVSGNAWSNWEMNCNYDLETYPYNLP